MILSPFSTCRLALGHTLDKLLDWYAVWVEAPGHCTKLEGFFQGSESHPPNSGDLVLM